MSKRFAEASLQNPKESNFEDDDEEEEIQDKVSFSDKVIYAKCIYD